MNVYTLFVAIIYSCTLVVGSGIRINSSVDTSRHWDIAINASNGGWAEFVHHLDMVAWSRPICSANHLLVLSFSAKTTFNLLSLFFWNAFLFSKVTIFTSKSLGILENQQKKRKIISVSEISHSVNDYPNRTPNTISLCNLFKLKARFLSLTKDNDHERVLRKASISA